MLDDLSAPLLDAMEDFNPRFHKDDQGAGPIKILPALGGCLLWVALLPGLAIVAAWRAIRGR